MTAYINRRIKTLSRVDKDNYYLDIAHVVLSRSTCLRRKYGAVIVNNDEIISTGYNGAPRGEVNCVDCGKCKREELGVNKGERYELCEAVHAEQNAIISASRDRMMDAVMYITGIDSSNGQLANPEPCMLCRRFIINSGIKRVIGRWMDGTVKIVYERIDN